MTAAPSPADVIAAYTDAYNRRDVEAVLSFLPEQQVRHEVGERQLLASADNRARIEAFLARFPTATFTNHLVTVDGELVTIVWSLTMATEAGAETSISSIEVFRVVGGTITEVWNAPAASGVWA